MYLPSPPQPVLQPRHPQLQGPPADSVSLVESTEPQRSCWLLGSRARRAQSERCQGSWEQCLAPFNLGDLL